MSWPTVCLVDKRPADATAAPASAPAVAAAVSASVDVSADAVMRKRTVCCLLPGCPVLFIVALLQSPESPLWKEKKQNQHKTQPPLRIRCQTSVLCLPCFQENSLNFPTDSSERERRSVRRKMSSQSCRLCVSVPASTPARTERPVETEKQPWSCHAAAHTHT